MHVAIVTSSLSAGGAERVIAQLLKEWCKSGVKCSLILLNKKELFYSIPSEVDLYEIGKLHKKHYIDKLKKYARVRKLIKEIKPDVVLSMPEEIGIYVIGALLGTKYPVVVSERNNPWVMPDKKATRILRKLLYPFADGFIFQTKQAASFFSKKIQKKGIVLPNPLDLSRIPERYEGEREKTIVGAGRLFPQKNFKLLIDAFAKFYETHTSYKLVIYGEGYLREELINHAASKLPEAAFSFPGQVDNLPDKINKASAFVLSSDFEGMPNVLIEALAMGVPSVSVDCAPGGAAELIEDGVNGYLVPIGDKDALSERLSYLIDNKTIAESFSKKSIEIKQKLDAHIVCKEWCEYIIKKQRNS
ncbi:MAG: glycosyltransferase [Clostridia bacterium]|nr:glycosyltransferase [Clostridia bacterium]